MRVCSHVRHRTRLLYFLLLLNTVQYDCLHRKAKMIYRLLEPEQDFGMAAGSKPLGKTQNHSQQKALGGGGAQDPAGPSHEVPSMALALVRLGAGLL